MANKRLTVKTTAALLGMDRNVLAELLRRGCEYGSAIKLNDRTYSYIIIPSAVADHLGISVEQLYKRIEELKK